MSYSSYRSRRGCDRIGPRPTSAPLTHNTYRESADRRSGTRGGTSSTSNTRRNCARENLAGGRSEPTLVGSITNSGTSGATQRPRHRTPGKSAVDISEPDVVSEVDLDRKAVAGLGDSIRPGVHRSEPD